jgi:diketogulonate reductase-like aldo/keto reductase
METAGRIRYSGITHYESGALGEIEKLMRSQKFDFLQINYSLMEPEAEERVLPLAQERGVAVIANRPFGVRRSVRQSAFEAAAGLGNGI